ncbi:MAG: ferredoxin family protein [Candidatus Adiutrix sp.]|jgi:adenylylsulfate reductase subunit B|nr:ferredoxin family protein [Candidatus Adiutrix sp.]
MSIIIDPSACTGCGLCREVCPGNLLCADENGRAAIRRPADCWNCAACLKACAQTAIALYLPPEIGGNGASLRVSREGDLLHWLFSLPDGRRRVITVDRRNANHY